MGNNMFWSNALKYGAILGAVMGVSKLFEIYVMYYSDMPLDNAAITYLVEFVAILVLYVWMLYRFTKIYSNQFDSRLGFKFTTGLGYILSMNILAAIIVGVLTTIFYSIMGYDGYIEGYLMRMDEFAALIEEHGPMDETMIEYFETTRDNIEGLQQPSMLVSISSYVYVYIFSGLIIGAIIALITRRKPVLFDDSQYEE